MFSEVFLQAIAASTATVLGVTELLKRWWKIKGASAVVLSILVSFAVALPALDKSLIQYLTLAIFTALSANGVFKVAHTPGRKR